MRGWSWSALLCIALVLSGCTSDSKATPNQGAPVTSEVDAGEGTSSIEGSVLDDSELPVGGASVRVSPYPVVPNGTHYDLTTDESGKFRVGGLQPGKYQILALKIQYEPAKPVVVDVADGEPTQVTIKLVPIEAIEPFHTSTYSRLRIASFVCVKLADSGGDGCGGLYYVGNWTFKYDNTEDTLGPLMTLLVESRWSPQTPFCTVGLFHDIFSPDQKTPFAHSADNPFSWSTRPDAQTPQRLQVDRDGPDGMTSPDRVKKNKDKALKVAGAWTIETTWEPNGAVPGSPVIIDCAAEQSYDVIVTAFHGTPAPPDWTGF